MPPNRQQRKPSAEQQAKKRAYLTNLARKKAQQAQQAKQAGIDARNKAKAQRWQQEQQNRIRRAKQVEQQARARAESQAQAAAEARQKAIDARSEAARKRRLQRAGKVDERRDEMQAIRDRSAQLRAIQIKQGDTAESLAKQYGVDPKLIADAVTTLRPGQVISVSDRAKIRARIEDRARMEGRLAELQTGPGTFTGHEEARDRDERYWDTGFQGDVQRAITEWSDRWVSQPLKDFGAFYGDVASAAVDPLRQQTPEERQRAYLEEQLGAEGYGSRYQEYRDPSEELGSAETFADPALEGQIVLTEEQLAAQKSARLFSQEMAGTREIVSEAYNAYIAGDMDSYNSWMKNRVFTASTFNNGTGQPIWDNLNVHQQGRLIEMGYMEVETGLWVQMELEEPDYGMGGYTFPGYGDYGGYGGGGYGGGEYEYLSRGGIQRRKSGGGASRGERSRIFPEGVSPAHWRI